MVETVPEHSPCAKSTEVTEMSRSAAETRSWSGKGRAKTGLSDPCSACAEHP